VSKPPEASVASSRQEIDGLRKEIQRLQVELASAKRRIDGFRALEAELLMAQVQTVEAIVEAIEAKDPYTSGHSRRVAELSLQIGSGLKLTNDKLWRLHIAALVHDVGKIGVYDSSLRKASRLNDEEYLQLKEHPLIGERIISKIDHFADIAPIVRWHHERYDGKGYPDHLVGDEIPVESAIVCIADTYDAITSKRTYSKARTTAEALDEIDRNAGTQFSPAVVAALRQALLPNELMSITLNESDFALDFEIPDEPTQPNQYIV